MSEEAAAFDALAEEFFSVWFRYHPDVAAAVGVPGFEGLLPAQGDDELAALGNWLETLVVALEEIDYGALDETRRIDLRLMFGAARVEHQELLERDWRHRDPLRFLPVAEMVHLVLHVPEDAGVPLARLLEALPNYLRLATSQLYEVPELIAPALAAAAADEAERGRCWLRELTTSPWIRRQCPDSERIRGLADAACIALATFARTLAGDLAQRAGGSLSCGAAHLIFLMRHRHFVELDPKRARATLADALVRTEEQIAAVGGKPSADRVPESLTGPGVSTAQRLETARRESDRLRALLEDSGLLGLPEAPLRICERTSCPRPRRMPSDYLAQADAGTLFLGPAAADNADGERMAALRGRVFEGGWGGSHLTAFAGGAEARRLPRRLCAASSFNVAWGLYLSDRLAAAGLLGPEEQLFRLLRRAQVLRRALLDLDVHLKTPVPAASLDADLVALSRRPGDALAGALGWEALSRARALLVARRGDAFDERAFHDGLLARGPIPLPLILCAELGGGLWREICGPWSDPSAPFAA